MTKIQLMSAEEYTDFTVQPIDYVRPFVKRARELGDDATLILAPDARHFEPLVPSHPAGQLAIETILS